MSRVIKEAGSANDASIVPAGTWAAITQAKASGGSYLSSSTGGSTITITVATGVTGVLLLCTRIANGTPGNVATVTVDGALQPDTWNQNDFTTAAASAGQTWAVPAPASVSDDIAWYQSAYRPISFANTGITHTVVIGISSGTVTFDAYEAYTSTTPTAGRVLSAGHSIPSGFGLGTPATQRYGAVLAALIGGAETSSALASESLAGGNTNVATPGYQKYAGTGAWWDQTPEIALMMEARNDSLYYTTQDPGGGLGYCHQRHLQRNRELIWRMNLNVPGALILLLGNLYETAGPSDRLLWDADLQAVALESTVSNVWYVPLWAWSQNLGLATDVSQDGLHPTATGAALVAREIARKAAWMRQRQGGRTGAML